MGDAPIAAQNTCEIKRSPALPPRLQPPVFPAQTTLDMRGAILLLHSPRGKRPRGILISGVGNKSLPSQVLLISAVNLRRPRPHPGIGNGLLASLLAIQQDVPNRRIRASTFRVSSAAPSQSNPSGVSLNVVGTMRMRLVGGKALRLCGPDFRPAPVATSFCYIRTANAGSSELLAVRRCLRR
jgi:hypothetical protein